MKKTLRMVSRTSQLALFQAQSVKTQLQALYPDLIIEITGIKTEGDYIIDTSLAKIGGKGLFVKALQDYLLTGKADIAVHSVKDMPAEFPEGLILAAILKRDDPRDVLVSQHFSSVAELPPKARVGTSSLRRQAQFNRLRSDLTLESLRGNVDTRLKKLSHGQYDALILAAAGLHRLNETAAIKHYFSTEDMLPAIGQGALGIECRLDDTETQQIIQPLHHLPTAHCILAERSVSAALGGGCQLPLAGLATLESNGSLQLTSCVGMPNGSRFIRATLNGQTTSATDLGKAVAALLLADGAEAILKACC